MEPKQLGMIFGAVIGAILGAGAAFLLMTAPADPDPDEEPDKITAGDLIGLTGSAALLVRKLDDIRRKT